MGGARAASGVLFTAVLCFVFILRCDMGFFFFLEISDGGPCVAARSTRERFGEGG